MSPGVSVMGRGRGKGKKQSVLASREDGSGEEEKVPAKRRGRPTKVRKDEIEEEEEVEKIEDSKNADTKSSVTKATIENDRKRKRPSQLKGSHDLLDEENVNGVGVKANGNSAAKTVVGFRQNGSRRKNKPRRAAEVGVECK